MKASSVVPVAILVAVVFSEPIPVHQGALVKRQDDCANSTISSFEASPVTAPSSASSLSGYGGYWPPYGGPPPYGYSYSLTSTGSSSSTEGSPITPWNSTVSVPLGTSATGGFPSSVTLTASSTSNSSVPNFFSLPRTGTDSISSTEGSPVTASSNSASTSTHEITHIITLSVTATGSVSILPITNSTTPIFFPSGYEPPPAGYSPPFPYRTSVSSTTIPGSASSSSTEGSPVTASHRSGTAGGPSYPTPCNETAPGPTAPAGTSSRRTITRTETLTLTNGTITNNIPGGTGTAVTPGSTPGSPITAGNSTTTMPMGTGAAVPYPYPPFPYSYSNQPRSGNDSTSATHTGTAMSSSSFPISPITAGNSTSSLPGPTGAFSSPIGYSNTTITSATAYTVAPSTGPLSLSSNSSVPVVSGTGTLPGVSGTGTLPSASTPASPVTASNSTSSMPMSTGIPTIPTPSGPFGYSFPPWLPFPPISTGVLGSITPASGTGTSTTLVSPVTASNSTAPIGPTATPLPSSMRPLAPYPPFIPSGSTSSTEGSPVTASSGFTTLTSSATTSNITYPSATNTPYNYPSGSRYPPGGYGPPPEYGSGYGNGGGGWWSGWGRAR